MANTLRIKRRASGATGAPASLANAELAYNEVDDILYYGKGNSGGVATTVEAIGGNGHVVNLTGTQSITGAKTFASNVSLAGNRIIDLADPVSAQDAATKAYVDGMVQGLDIKPSVRAASTAHISNLSGLQTVDGVALAAGDRVLVKNQDTATAGFNGIYIASSSTWFRAADLSASAQFPNAFVFVEEGTVNGDTGWVCTNNTGVVVGTTKLTFVQFSGSGTINAGDGLTQAGNTFNVNGTADRITVGASTVDIASTYVGQTSITTLGTISTGTWNGTTIAVAKGGTGSTTAAGARTNLGATTVGANLFTLANPSAIRFLRINADNTATALDAAAFRTAIGAGTSSTTGTVTSVALSGGTTGLTVTGSPITTSGTITLAGTLALANGGTGATTAAAARTNLGLGTVATQNSNGVAITGGSITNLTTFDGITIDGGTF